MIALHVALVIAIALIAIVAVFVGGAFLLKVDTIFSDLSYKLRDASKFKRAAAFVAAGAAIQLGVAGCTLIILTVIEQL